jgi:hypothetical protein
MELKKYKELHEAYKKIYSSPILNEFSGATLSIKRTFGGAPGTSQNTSISGAASLPGRANVSGSLTKGTFSGQGDKINQGIDNAIDNYDKSERGVANPKPLDTSTSTITKGVRGTLNANISGRIGPGNNIQQKLAAAAKPKVTEKPKTPKAAETPGTPKATEKPKTPNSTYDQDRVALTKAGITDESGNENPGSKQGLENRLDGPNRAIAGDLLNKLRNVSDTNRAEVESRPGTVGARRIQDLGGGRYGLKDSFDFFDNVLNYLLDEGYADTEKSAEVIMANMSKVWLRSIIE